MNSSRNVELVDNNLYFINDRNMLISLKVKECVDNSINHSKTESKVDSSAFEREVAYDVEDICKDDTGLWLINSKGFVYSVEDPDSKVQITKVSGCTLWTSISKSDQIVIATGFIPGQCIVYVYINSFLMDI